MIKAQFTIYIRKALTNSLEKKRAKQPITAHRGSAHARAARALTREPLTQPARPGHLCKNAPDLTTIPLTTMWPIPIV